MKTTTYRDAIEELIGTEGPCVSITIPTFPTGKDRLEAPIRLKNRLAEAEDLLVKEGMRPTLAKDLLANASALVEDKSFWLHQGEGLALYVAPNVMRYFWLPTELEELTTVGSSFQIRPLVPMLDMRPYYILAIDQKNPRLFRAHGRQIHEMVVPDMPESIDAVVGVDYSEKQQQMHSAGPIGQAGSTISHGAGDRGADQKDRLLRFLQAVDRAMCGALNDIVSPVVLVADAPTANMFLNNSHYPNVHNEFVATSPKVLTAEDLLERVREVMEPIASRRETAERSRYAQMAGTGRTSADLSSLLRESQTGRVDVLFVNRKAFEWDKQAGEGRKEDLFNRLEVETLRNSGTVFELEPAEMPTATPVAGIYRY